MFTHQSVHWSVFINQFVHLSVCAPVFSSIIVFFCPFVCPSSCSAISLLICQLVNPSVCWSISVHRSVRSSLSLCPSLFVQPWIYSSVSLFIHWSFSPIEFYFWTFFKMSSHLLGVLQLYHDCYQYLLFLIVVYGIKEGENWAVPSESPWPSIILLVDHPTAWAGLHGHCARPPL